MVVPLSVGLVSGFGVAGFGVVGRGVFVVICVGRVVTVLVVTGVCCVTTGFVCSGEGVAVLTAELSGLLVVTTSEFVFPVFVPACSGVGSGVGVAEITGVGVGVLVVSDV
jgi:hypothetical protein